MYCSFFLDIVVAEPKDDEKIVVFVCIRAFRVGSLGESVISSK